MQTFSKYSPTPFDTKGIGSDSRENWLVVPVIQTRDSGPFEHSNFAVALEMLGGESDTVEVHCFNHWGPGWFEIIVVDPESPQATIAHEIEASLEDYPLLDDEDHSSREYEAYQESWESYGARDFVDGLREEFALTDSACDLLSDWDGLQEFYEAQIPSGEYYISESDGVCLNIGYACDKCQRDDMAHALRAARKAKRNVAA